MKTALDKSEIGEEEKNFFGIILRRLLSF